MYSLGELAQKLGLDFSGDAARTLTGLATLESAGPEDLAFLANRRYADQLGRTAAGAVIVPPDMVAQCPGDYLKAEDPYLCYARGQRPV